MRSETQKCVPRRTVLLGLVAASSGWSSLSFAAEEGWKSFELVTSVDLAEHRTPLTLYIPLLETRETWQRAGRPRIDTLGVAQFVRDRRYGSLALRVRWPKGEVDRKVVVTQRVATRDRVLEPATLTPDKRLFWTTGVASLPTDGIVRDTAFKIIGSKNRPRERARAIYDWVVDNAFRDEAVRGCGVGGVEAMLRTGYLGGKCADINSLMVDLCRSAGLPARDVYGVRLGPSDYVKCLGAGPDVTHAQHCRAEIWLEGEGWLPVDPADVAKAVNCSKEVLSSPLVRAQRDRLFGSWEMNWAAYNSATDYQPPGAPSEPAEHFLMYPMALSEDDELDQLDPARFRYQLTSRAAA